jgi:hypothetical protein
MPDESPSGQHEMLPGARPEMPNPTPAVRPRGGAGGAPPEASQPQATAAAHGGCGAGVTPTIPPTSG